MADKIESCVEANNSERRLTRSAVKKGVQIKQKNVIETNRSTKKSSKKPSLATRRQILEEESDVENDSISVNDDDDLKDIDYIAEKNSDDEYSKEHSDDDDENEDYSDEERLITPLALISDTDFTGQEVFGFQTPGKRTGSLAKAASEAIHVKKYQTPASSKKGTKRADKIKTSERKRNQDREIQEEEEEKQSQHIKKSKRIGTPTINRRPSSYQLRGRPQILLQSFNESDEDSDPVSGSDNESETGSATINSTASAQKKSIKFDAVLPEDTKSMMEEYFAVHHDSKSVTSDRTLASLATPLMDQDEVSKHLHQVSATHPTESLRFYQDYRKYFPKWMFQIRHGFNVLLYGLGSKRVLIDQFRSSMLQGYTQLVVNGFFPSITIKNILNNITEDVLEYDGAFKSVIDQTTFIQETFRKGKGPGELYLIIHNIDGTMLRSKKAQTVLSLLAEVPFIHVIASVDHINAPLVWDQCMCSRFKFLWYDVTTFEPYTEETSYENSLLVQQSGALALSSMNHVMRSLTPNGQGIFLLIVNQQLLEKDNSSYIGFNISDLYNKCREKFLVNSEQTLRAQLTEFRDHKLIRSKKGTDGVEHLLIPLDAATLKQFLEEQQNNNS